VRFEDHRTKGKLSETYALALRDGRTNCDAAVRAESLPAIELASVGAVVHVEVVQHGSVVWFSFGHCCESECRYLSDRCADVKWSR